jgi:hypothetical protein
MEMKLPTVSFVKSGIVKKHIDLTNYTLTVVHVVRSRPRMRMERVVPVGEQGRRHFFTEKI